MTNYELTTLYLVLGLLSILGLYVVVSTQNHRAKEAKKNAPRTWVADYLGNQCYIGFSSTYLLLGVNTPTAGLKNTYSIRDLPFESVEEAMEVVSKWIIQYVPESNWVLTRAYEDLYKVVCEAHTRTLYPQQLAQAKKEYEEDQTHDN